MSKTHYLVRSKSNPILILTVSGEFVPESLCGPGMHCARIYKTRRGAENSDTGTVHTCDQYGVER